MGVALLKERFTWIEIIGVILALVGAFFVSLRKMEVTSAINNIFIPGTLIVLVNAILASTTSIIGKINVKKLTPELITLNATMWPLLSATILMVFFRESFIIPTAAFVNIAAGSFLGPFLGVLLIYYSFKFIEVSRSSIVQSLKGIIVLIGTLIYFGTLPEKHQLIFGLLSVLGVVIMTLAQAGFLRIRKSHPV
jgi:drug/metabolite transporter (DMT)-like permease